MQSPLQIIATFSAEERDLGILYTIIVFYPSLKGSAASMKADRSEYKVCSSQVL